MRSVDMICAEIESKLGFFPPFFEPALETPPILDNLWQQTVSAYLDNPLPSLFKEKLAALLARFCTVPYCLICHSCTLRPLGMSAYSVLQLLEQPLLSFEEIEQRSCFSADNQIESWPESGSEMEDCILQSCVLIFLHNDAERSHLKLRKVLPKKLYTYLILFLAYNRTCLTWAEGHPELAYNSDFRVENNWEFLVHDEPKLSDFFANYQQRVQMQLDRRATWLTTENQKFLSDVKTRNNTLILSEGKLRAEVITLEDERKLREQFVATLTHDLKNPLSTAKMGAQLIILKDPSNTVVIPLAEQVVKSVDRANDMIEDLLYAVQLQAGEKFPLKTDYYNLNTMLLESVIDLRLMYGDRIEFHSSDSITMRLDWAAVRRAIENLVGNAVKYGAPGKRISVSLILTNPGWIGVAVHNEGLPIDKDAQESIFSPYQRTVSARAGSEKGWGIGLVLVKGITEAHGGEVKLVSSIEEGTTFTMLFPTQ